MGRVAYEDTTVSVEKSQAEIRRLLREFGVQDMQFQELGSAGTVDVRFRYEALEVDFKISPGALLDELCVAHRRTDTAVLKKQSERIMWRQLFNYLKAALLAIRYRVRTPEQILLAAIVLPGGVTFGEKASEILPQLTSGRLALPSGEGD